MDRSKQGCLSLLGLTDVPGLLPSAVSEAGYVRTTKGYRSDVGSCDVARSTQGQ